MTEEDRAARHPQPGFIKCHRCKGSGTVGKASQFVLNDLGSVDHSEWDSICPVCDGKGMESVYANLAPETGVCRPH